MVFSCSYDQPGQHKSNSSTSSVCAPSHALEGAEISGGRSRPDGERASKGFLARNTGVPRRDKFPSELREVSVLSSCVVFLQRAVLSESSGSEPSYAQAPRLHDSQNTSRSSGVDELMIVADVDGYDERETCALEFTNCF